MDLIIYFLKKPIFKKIVIFAVIIFFLFLLRDLMSLFLLTFVFIYIFNSAQSYIFKYLNKIIPIKRGIIVSFLYVAFVAVLVIIARIYIPVVIAQSNYLIKWLTDYINEVKSMKPSPDDNLFTKLLLYVVNNVEISKYISSGGNTLLSVLTKIGTIGFYTLVSLILSIFFMTERKRINQFVKLFKKSSLYWMYDETRYFFFKFANSFGKVIQTQILISFINSLLSMIMLSILGFDNILGLTVMIFFLGLVPVVGVFISLIPLTIIAYSISLRMVIYILVMIAILHALESYILNPKLMSDKTKLPVFFTFLVLIVSEHFLGVWGLIVGLPITMFLLDVFGVIPEDAIKKPGIIVKVKNVIPRKGKGKQALPGSDKSSV